MLRKAIQGTWDLVSYTAQDNHGGPTTYPLGPDALGLIMYIGDGYMSAQLMRRGRPAHSSARRYRNHQHSGVEMRRTPHRIAATRLWLPGDGLSAQT